MKKPVFIILLSILMSASVFAQKVTEKKAADERDLSGTWILDEEKSQFSTYNEEIDDKEKEGYENYALTITQKESEIKIIKSYTFRGKESKYTITLFADNRSEQNIESYRRQIDAPNVNTLNLLLEEANIKSETVWKKGKLIRKGSFQGNVGMPNFRVEKNHLVKEVYELSDDSQTLVVEIDLQILNSPTNIGFRRSKLTFHKDTN